MPQLDVGGGATADAVKKAFELLLSSPNVKSIFVNICKLSHPLSESLLCGAAGVARGMNSS